MTPDTKQRENAPTAGQHRLWSLFAVAAVVGTLFFVACREHDQGSAKNSAAPDAGTEGRVVPVTTATVERKDVPIYLEGLGTITALKTVSVRARVDGQLDKILFREGQQVHVGSPLAQIDPRPFEIQLHQAEAALARDNAQLHGAKLDLDRYAAVSEQNLIAQQQVDQQRALVGQLEGTVKADQTQVESARLQIVYAHITSPIDGVTGVRLVDPGNIVHATDASGIVTLTQLDPIALLFTLPEDDLPRIAKRMGETTLEVAAINRDGDSELGRGKVMLIDNQINTSTATIRMKAELPNREHKLWPNQFVKARLLLETQKDALIIPAAGVQRGPNGTFVYIVGGDNKAALRPIELDILQGDLAIVAKGLKPGETVVVDGQSQLRPGASISARPRPSPSNAGSTGGGGPAHGPKPGPSR